MSRVASRILNGDGKNEIRVWRYWVGKREERKRKEEGGEKREKRKLSKLFV